jgi:hypothetical protein
MRISIISENVSYYTVIDAFRRDGAGRLWICDEYEASERPNKSRCMEVLRTPDGRYHLINEIPLGVKLTPLVGHKNMARCEEPQESIKSIDTKGANKKAKEPGFEWF